MPGHVRDRWHIPDPDSPRKKIRTQRYGKGKRWQAIWIEPDGTRRSESFELKDAAEAKLDAINHQLRSHAYIPAERSRIKFSVYYQMFTDSQQHRRPNTRRTAQTYYKNVYKPHLGEKPIGSITREDIQNLVNGLAGNYAPTTIKNIISNLSPVFTTAVFDGYIVKSPIVRIRIPEVDSGRKNPIGIDDVKTLAEAMPADYRRACLFNACVGLRPGELCAIEWEDIEDLPEGTARLTVSKQVDRQGQHAPLKTKNSYRVILIGAHARAFLGERGEGPIFHTVLGKKLTTLALRTEWAKARDKTGVQATGWHELRHFHASQLIAAGVSPVAVARRLGHKDATETLRTYAHLWPDDDERMADAAERFL